MTAASLPLKVFTTGIVLVVAGGLLWWGLGTGGQKILLPIASEDTVSSWNFDGAYAGNQELQAKARTEIERLGRLAGNSEEFTEYQLYVSIAANYELLGDGAKAYDFLNRAVAIDPSHTGLAWANLGELMERLGAFHTGRVAYAKAVEAQPGIMGYHLARLTFLTQHFAEDTIAVEGAFSEATAQFGEIPQTLQIKAQWLAETGRTAEAIAAWKSVRNLVGEGGQSGIDREVKRLEAAL